MKFLLEQMNWFVTKYETSVHKLKLYFALLIAKNERKYDTMQMITFEIPQVYVY